MINPYIKEQLEKCEVADIPSLKEDPLNISIPKKSKNKRFQLNKCYIIELDDYLINPNSMVSFHINWNQSRVPKSKYLKVCIIQIMGKMIKIDGLGYNIEVDCDLNDIYNDMWLPSQDVRIIKEI